MRAIWKALKSDDYGDIVRLLMLTGQRRDEIGSLRWSEIDLKNAMITLPGARCKRRSKNPSLKRPNGSVAPE